MGDLIELADYAYTQVPVTLGKNGTLSMTVTRTALTKQVVADGRPALKLRFLKRRGKKKMGPAKVLEFPVI